jgi:hypothetical protein
MVMILKLELECDFHNQYNVLFVIWRGEKSND